MSNSQIIIEDHLIGDGSCSETVEVSFWLDGSLSLEACSGGWFVWKENRKIASFVLKDSRFLQNIRDITVHGAAYNKMVPATGVYWSSKGVQEWKIEWTWLESI